MEKLVSVVLGKVFGQGRGGSKVSIGLSVAWIIAALIGITGYIDPGLSSILAGHEATMLAFVGLVQAIFMYYRKETVL